MTEDALIVACRHCGSVVGQVCVKMDGSPAPWTCGWRKSEARMVRRYAAVPHLAAVADERAAHADKAAAEERAARPRTPEACRIRARYSAHRKRHGFDQQAADAYRRDIEAIAHDVA